MGYTQYPLPWEAAQEVVLTDCEMGLSRLAAPGKTLQYAVSTYSSGQASKCTWEKRAIAWDLPASPRDTLEAKVPTAYYLRDGCFQTPAARPVQIFPTKGGAVTRTSHTPSSSRKASSQILEFHNALITASASSPSCCPCSTPSPAHRLPRLLQL